MYHLRTLGNLDLRAPGGERVDGLLAQPRRAALFVFLVLARPRGPVRRDVLLSRFWADFPEARGRAALRNALSFLRRSLPGLLEPRPDDAVEVSAAALRCDVWEMEAALERGDDAGALELYGGELLAGFHAGGGGDWQSWLDAERRRLARLAADAATRLASLAEAKGDANAELRWRRVAVESEPHDEVALRALLLALDAAGDRAGALAAYETFARALRRAYDTEPATETAVLVRAIRDRRPAAALPRPVADRVASPPVPRPTPPVSPVAAEPPAAAPAVPAADVGPDPGAGVDPGPAADLVRVGDDAPGVDAAPNVDAASRGDVAPGVDAAVHTAAGHQRGEADSVASPALASVPRRRRSARWGIAAGVLAALLLVFILLRPSGPAAVRPAGGVPTRVAVLPFAIRTGPGYAYLGEGMMDLVSVRLDGTGELTTVDPFALLGFLRTTPEPAGMAAGMSAARRFGAGHFVLGSVLEAGGRLHLQAALYDERGRRRGNAEVAEVREDSLFGAVDLLVRRLVANELRGPRDALDRTAALTTASLPALKAYLSGQRAFRRGMFGEASAEFARAAAADTGFALAHYRMSVAQDWAAEDGSAAAARALAMGERLPQAERQLLQVRVAFRTGSAARAEQLCRALLAVHPDHVEALNELGEILFHRAMWQGRSLAVSREAWQRLVALDSSNISARVHLAGVAALEGHAAEVDTLVGQIARLSPRHEPLTRLRLLSAVALADPAREARVMAELRRQAHAPRDARDDPPWGAAWRTADFLEDPAAGLRAAAMMTEPFRSPRGRLVGYTTRAHLEMARGRWRAARAALDTAATLDAGYAARTRAFLFAFAPVAVPAEEVVRARRALLATAVPRPDGVGDVVDHEKGAFPAARHAYLLGALAVALGDTAEVRRRVDELGAPADTGVAAAVFARHLRHQLRARQLRAERRYPEALREVERGWPEPVAAVFVKNDSYSTVAERYLRAELLAHTGRDAEALRWYGSLAEDISRGLLFPTAAHLPRGRALERLGRPAQAAAEYRRFLVLFGDADAEAGPSLADARARLGRLPAAR